LFSCLLDLAEQVDVAPLLDFLPGIKYVRLGKPLRGTPHRHADSILEVIAQNMVDVLMNGTWAEDLEDTLGKFKSRIFALDEKYPRAGFDDVLAAGYDE
jgi:hypothetical protein